MTNQQAAFWALNFISEKLDPHKDYARTVEVAKEARAFSTGVLLHEYMKPFTRRESPELFKQRVDITTHLSKEVVSNIASVFQKAPRAVQKTVNYINDITGVELTRLAALRESFWGDKTLEDYTDLRLIELNKTDPNAWVVLEWKDYDGNFQGANPYPFEVFSKDALDWKTESGKVTAFLCRYEGDENTPERYTAYLENQSVSVERASSINVGGGIPFPNSHENIQSENVYKCGNEIWRVVFHRPHNLGYVLAWRIGINRDETTDGRTFVSLFDAALPRLHKMLKVNSEMDLTAALVAFPLSISYESPCEADGCMDGTVHDGTKCYSCKGTGVKQRPTSVQEQITIPLPRHKEEMVDLNSILTYKSPPLDIIAWMDGYVDKLTEKAKQAVFNSEVFTRSQVAETATGKSIDLENVYDVLYKFAIQHARIWEWLIFGIADVAGIGNGLNARAAVTKDFRLKGLEDLLLEYEAMGRVGASTQLRLAAESEIAKTMFSGQPERMTEFATLTRLNPFSGVSETAATVAILSEYIPDRTRIIHYNFKQIIERCKDVAMSRGIDFFAMNKAEQDSLFQNSVNEIEATIKRQPRQIAPE